MTINAKNNLMNQNVLIEIYETLYNFYGPQGWWPVYTKDSDFVENNKAYHPENYSIPQNSFERFQITTGAILTQNTNWNNVVKALFNIHKAGINDFHQILELEEEQLAEHIRPSGYYNQKAKKLKMAAEYFTTQNNIPTRDEVLSLWGIGEETADSILLYTFHQASFVIDNYTKRLLYRKKIIPNLKTKYSQIQQLFYQNFPHNINKYKEYHALIVQHAKEFCRAKPICSNCIFSKQCSKRIDSNN